MSPPPSDESRTEPLAGAREPRAPASSGSQESDAPRAHDLERGTRVERYVVLKSVGRGGMGVVYAAYDPDLDRKVALKLLRPDKRAPEGMTGREWVLREAQAMARVSHPNVISVYDVGTFDAQVFMAMEFLQGQSLHTWLQQERGWRETLELFLQAGQGLLAAHRAGLVHRDFKPANVLVAESGRVCVLDFGLALLATDAEQAEATLSGEPLPCVPRGAERTLVQQDSALVMGTPQYMPPEQYLGSGVDARADQFSFCASLYWALFHERPFEPRLVAQAASEASRVSGGGTGPGDVWRQLPHGSAAHEPLAQARVPARVRRAVLRGLSLHPEDRFPSMEALLAALAGDAHRGRRRGAMVAVGTVALAALGVGGYLRHQSQVCAGAGSRIESVWGPATRLRLETAFQATGTPFAADSARQVVRLLDGYADRWARLGTEACEATRVSGVQTEALLSLRVVCLERRLQDLGALTGLLTEADAKVVERAVDAASALPALEPCQDIASLAEQPPLPADPALRATLERLGTQLARVKALHDAGRYKAALALAESLEPEVSATAWLPLRAELHQRLGWLRQQQGEAEASIQQLETAFDFAESSRSDRTRLEVLIKLIYTQATHGHAAEARRSGRVALALLHRLGGEAPLALELMGNLGNVALMQGRYREAWDSFEKARALQDRALAPEDPKRARVSHGLGLTALRLGDFPRAISLLTEALQRTEAAKGRQHPETATRHGTLAQAYRESGDLTRALEHVQVALEVRRAALGPRHPAVADALDELGMSLIELKRHDEAVATFNEAAALKRAVLGEEHPDLAYSYDGVGQALLAAGKAREAIAPLRQALSYVDTDPEQLALTGFALAKALWQAGEPPALARQQALEARERYVTLEKAPQAAEIEAWLTAHPEDAAVAGPPPKRKAGR